jgi:hypothetical protein
LIPLRHLNGAAVFLRHRNIALIAAHGFDSVAVWRADRVIGSVFRNAVFQMSLCHVKPIFKAAAPNSATSSHLAVGSCLFSSVSVEFGSCGKAILVSTVLPSSRCRIQIDFKVDTAKIQLPVQSFTRICGSSGRSIHKEEQQ